MSHLQVSERLDLCLSAGNLAWWEMDIKTGKVIFNENKVKMLGYEMSDFKNADYNTFMDLVHPDDYDRTMKAMQEHLDGKKPLYETEYRIKTKNEHYKWYYDRGSIIKRDDKNKALKVAGVVIDISKLKQAEILEKLSNKILSILNRPTKKIDEIHDILKVIKAGLNIQAVGIRIKEGKDFPYYESNGFPEEFIRQTSHICSPKKSTDDFIKDIDCMCGHILTGKVDTKHPFYTENGSFWTNSLSELLKENPANIKKIFTRSQCIDENYESIALVPIKAEKEVIGLIQVNDKRKNILSKDIVLFFEGIGSSIGIAFKRDESVKELSISEKRYSLAQRAADIGSWDWNILTGELNWSEKIEPMFGFKSGEFKKTFKAFLDLVHPKDRELVTKSVNESIETGRRYAIEHRIIWPDGTIRWVSERGEVIRDKKDKATHMFGVVQDITNKKEIENLLKKNRDELEKTVESRTHELQESNKKLKEEISQRKKAEEYTKRTREYLRNVIDSATELVIAFDMNNRVTTWNKTVQNLTGYKTIEVINRSVGKLNVFENSENLLKILKNICGNKKTDEINIILRTKNNDQKIIKINGSPIHGNNKECLGALLIGKDITRDQELHGKILEGCSYLIPVSNNKTITDLIIDFSGIENNNILFVTRENPAMLQSIIPHAKNIQTVLLSQQSQKDYTTLSEIEDIIKTIKTYIEKNKKSMIFFDGLHYLLTRFDFQKLINMVYQINDFIAKNNAIMFLRVDPLIVEKKQMAIFENELSTLPSQKVEDLIIEDDVYQILKYIKQQNDVNAVVSYKKIMSKFDVVYATAARKIDSLRENKLIFTKKQGKLRTIYVTDKGNALLNKRKTA